jgi:F420-non-reducing hydrogenase small subunit
MMTLGSNPLGFLASKADPIKAIKMDPDKVVDFKAAGYPEVVNQIVGAMMVNLKDNPKYSDSAATVCSACERNIQDKRVIRYKRDYVGMPDTEKCLLVQGYVCMGPITKAGCGATCCRANSPCLGCYGPALDVEDFGTKALSLFPAICEDDPENIKKFFSDPAGLFNRFCVPTSKLQRKIGDK